MTQSYAVVCDKPCLQYISQSELEEFWDLRFIAENLIDRGFCDNELRWLFDRLKVLENRECTLENETEIRRKKATRRGLRNGTK